MRLAVIHSTEIATSVDGISVLLLLRRHEVDRGPSFVDESKTACVETIRNVYGAKSVHQVPW